MDIALHLIIMFVFFVKLVIDPSGPAFDLNVPVEVIIGTIPLQSAVQQYQQTLSSAPSAPPQVAMRMGSFLLQLKLLMFLTLNFSVKYQNNFRD